MTRRPSLRIRSIPAIIRPPRIWSDGGAGSALALPPPLAGKGGEGEATGFEQAAPPPSLQPKSDLSDFGPLLMPKSGKPDFGAGGGGAPVQCLPHNGEGNRPCRLRRRFPRAEDVRK